LRRPNITITSRGKYRYRTQPRSSTCLFSQTTLPLLTHTHSQTHTHNKTNQDDSSLHPDRGSRYDTQEEWTFFCFIFCLFFPANDFFCSTILSTGKDPAQLAFCLVYFFSNKNFFDSAYLRESPLSILWASRVRARE